MQFQKKMYSENNYKLDSCFENSEIPLKNLSSEIIVIFVIICSYFIYSKSTYLLSAIYFYAFYVQ